MMLLVGAAMLLFILLINSGHTSSALSTGEDIGGILLAITLLAGALYALKPVSNK